MSLVETELSAGVMSITLNRPDKRNALKREFIEQIHEAVKEARGNREVRVVAFKANGSVFCAGMDLGEMQERAQSEDSANEWKMDSQVYCELLVDVLTLEVPTIAVLQGPVLAGGVGLVLACDMVIATDNSFFALPEPARGITAAMVTPLLVHRIGAGPASYMLLSQQRVGAEQAARFGLCHETVAANELDERFSKLCESTLSGSRSALSITKNHIAEVAGQALIEQVRYSIEVSARARETTDAREGLDAFLEKRKPTWQK